MGPSVPRSRGATHRIHKKTPRQSAKPPQPASVGPQTPKHQAKVFPSWSTYLLLAAVTAGLLVPFSGRAFHVDDTLFVWTAQHITKHPFNPYGYELIWDTTRLPMSEVTQNPPLASYYAAVVGALAGWSERAFHLAFLLPALVVVLGTYRLAQRFTKSPLLAALATLLTPGFMVSALSVMCDTLMVAIWMLAAILWIEGDEDGKPLYPVISALFIAACALTKYFGVALIPLFFVYSLVRRRRIGTWALPLLLPVLILAAYEIWTSSLYGTGLLSRAAEFAQSQRASMQVPYIANAAVAASFAGGCALTALLFALQLWSRKFLLIWIAISMGAASLILSGWLDLGLQIGGSAALASRHQHWMLIGIQLTLSIAGGLSILALAATDLWRRRDAHSSFLTLWVLGTFTFAAFLNWTVNARSVLPLIPAVGILVARRLRDEIPLSARQPVAIGAALAVAGAISLCVAGGDTKLANISRQAAANLCAPGHVTVWFEGHWGFQYYMEACGAHPVDFSAPEIHSGDWVVIPENNVELMNIPPSMVESAYAVEFGGHSWASTIRSDMAAGFYSSAWGPLPFVFGPIPPERYEVLRMR